MEESRAASRGKDVHEIEELKRQGLSIRAISRLTGYDRKTTGKYLTQPEAVPVFGLRPAQPSKLDPFKPYRKSGRKRACGMRKCCCGNCGSVATRVAHLC